MTKLPNRKGTYALVLYLKSMHRCCVGKMGGRAFKRGYYVYVGSAFGPGGLAARINHHLQPAIRPHWHIDYLSIYTRPKTVWFACADLRLEHTWASAVESMPDAKIPAAGFGSTDCRCISHLFYFSRQPLLETFRSILLNKGFDQEIRQARHPAHSDSRRK